MVVLTSSNSDNIHLDQPPQQYIITNDSVTEWKKHSIKITTSCDKHSATVCTSRTNQVLIIKYWSFPVFSYLSAVPPLFPHCSPSFLHFSSVFPRSFPHLCSTCGLCDTIFLGRRLDRVRGMIRDKAWLQCCRRPEVMRRGLVVAVAGEWWLLSGWIVRKILLVNS